MAAEEVAGASLLAQGATYPSAPRRSTGADCARSSALKQFLEAQRSVLVRGRAPQQQPQQQQHESAAPSPLNAA